jgi:hypothetical protein
LFSAPSAPLHEILLALVLASLTSLAAAAEPASDDANYVAGDLI